MKSPIDSESIITSKESATCQTDTLSRVVSNTLSKLCIASSSQAFYLHTNHPIHFFHFHYLEAYPKILKEKNPKQENPKTLT